MGYVCGRNSKVRAVVVQTVRSCGQLLARPWSESHSSNSTLHFPSATAIPPAK